jgi:hypothetical protein
MLLAKHFKKNILKIKLLDRKNVKTHVNEFYKFMDELAIIGAFIGDNDALTNLMGSMPKSFVGIIIAQAWNINTLIDTIKFQ